jgi:hypothetical protein
MHKKSILVVSSKLNVTFYYHILSEIKICSQYDQTNVDRIHVQYQFYVFNLAKANSNGKGDGLND